MSTGVKISALPTTASLMSSDIFPLVTGGVTRRAAFSMLPFSPMGSGATGRFIREKLIESVSPEDYGASGDGSTNDTNAISKAFASGKVVRGVKGRVYAVSGNITLPDDLDARDLSIKQLDPNNASRRTLTKTSGSGPITLRRVKVDKNGATTDGTITDAAGIWFANIDDITLEDVEVTGNSKGKGIFLTNCDRAKIVRPYVHDMRWTNGSDPGTEQIVGIWLDNCVDFDLIAPRVTNLDGQIGAAAVRAYQTDGILFGGTTNARLNGGIVQNVGEGLDVTGTVGNTRFAIIGTQAIDCDSYGFKFANSASKGVVIGTIAQDCGLVGHFVSGASADALPNCEDITFSSCKSLNTGSNGNWAAQNTCGFSVLAGSFNTAWPQGIRFVECEAIDDQAVPTMKYGFRSEPSVGAATVRPNRMFNCYSRGHTVAKTLDFIGDMWCSLGRTGQQGITSGVWSAINWNSEIEDPYSMGSITGPSINFREAGLHQLIVQAQFGSNTTGARMVRPVINGVPVQGIFGQALANSTTTAIAALDTILRIDNRTDVLTYEVFHNAGIQVLLVSHATFTRVIKLAGRE